MKLRDLIHAVDRSKDNTTSANIDLFCRELDLNEYPGHIDQFDEAVQGHWLIKWLCSDTWVGYIVYFMDNEPVAISSQMARKSSKELQFVSLEAAAKLRQFILECIGTPEFTPSVANLDEETDPYYTVSYSSQLLVSHGFFNGHKVKVERRCYRFDDPELQMDELMVSYLTEPDVSFKIAARDFSIPMHITDEAAALMGVALAK